MLAKLVLNLTGVPVPLLLKERLGEVLQPIKLPQAISEPLDRQAMRQLLWDR